jgi:hypothetical protein
MSKPQQIIFMNGPPESGKDTAALFIYEAYSHARMAKFAALLKETARVMFNLSHREVQELEKHANKNTRRPEFRGMSWRETLIWISEDVVKPKLGIDYFGVQLCKQLSEPTACDITAISDSGFRHEALPIIEHFGPENCHLFHIRRTGCTFKNDSRGYWEDKRVQTHVIDNRHTRDMFRVQILSRTDKILGVKSEIVL